MADSIDLIIKAAADKKAADLIKIDVRDLTVVADYFVICSAKSTTQVKAIADNIEEQLSKQGISPLRIDGAREGRWIAMDYNEVIVHIFLDELRLFYSIERLWANGDNITKYNNDK